MARVVVTRRASRDLERMRVTLHLPDDALQRVRARLKTLERFPELGAMLPGRWAPHRVLLGPWRWMLVVYRVDGDLVVIVTIADARSASSARLR